MNTFLFVSVIIGAIAGIWLGALGRHFHRNAILWAAGGVVGAIALGAICLGLADAVTLPYSDVQRARNLWAAAAIAIGLVGVIAGGITIGTDWLARRTRA